MSDKRLESASEIEFKGIRMPIIAVYRSPQDYPEKYVARVFDMSEPTDLVIVKEDFIELQRDIEQHTDMIWLSRTPKDVIELIGTWI